MDKASDDRVAEAIERLGGPMRQCGQCGEFFDVRGKENLIVYPLGAMTAAQMVPVAYYCSSGCHDAS